MRVLQQVGEVEQEQGEDARDEPPHGQASKDRAIFPEERENGAGVARGVPDRVAEGSEHAKDDLVVHEVQLQPIEDREVELEQGQDEEAHLEKAPDGREGADPPCPT